MTYLISPTEPAILRALGVTTMATEDNGADVMWASRHGLVGVQRKTVADAVSSVMDKRLGQQLNLLRERVAVPVVIIEGRATFNYAGAMTAPPVRFDISQWRGLMFSISAAGVWLLNSESLPDTLVLIEQLTRWLDKQDHTSMSEYGNAEGKFGLPPTREERTAYVIQAMVKGIGPKTALAIVKHFGGRIPAAWEVDEKAFLDVPGVGKTWARKLMEAL